MLGDLDGAPAELVGIVDRNVVRMLQLIDGLALLARLGAGQLALDLRLVDLPEQVAAAVDRRRNDIDPVEPDQAGPDLDIELDLVDGPPAIADPDRLGQVLDHLLGNAVTYTIGSGSATGFRPAAGRAETPPRA